jgi:hypothetical protein
LQTQVENNPEQLFTGSPDLTQEAVNAVMDSPQAQQSLSTQALNSDVILEGLKHILLNHLGLYEAPKSGRRECE